ncbi:MAG: 2-dehydro-3-deoxyphosphooctonate aldolase [Alphaproteobacteria bacterium MarineAlpha5_Bin9]|nr:MAG: 2-dehydro-3-deoxyphosphooctonate aldolase [Alphaproteobacteria bacterium MarineAlpha5_Bin9]|tara:strand:- start:3587 stop:4411 length:825 start_codon:yes stop_codon:yes gene_type:complete
MNIININNVEISNTKPFVLIAGPCVIENKKHSLKIAEKINNICNELKIKYIFKASFDKANRSSLNSNRGVGLKDSIEIFEKIKKEFNCPILTDVHTEDQCDQISEVADIIQIPAFLCRQTDLLIAAGKTQRVINIKKGQFLSPYEITNIINKIESTNNNQIILTERGTFFGYNKLVNDFKAIEIMKKTKYPVIYDATHSVQEPGGLKDKSGGKREFIPALSRAAIALGIAGIFIETHDNPEIALSDGPNMLNIENLKNLLINLKSFDEIAKKNN